MSIFKAMIRAKERSKYGWIDTCRREHNVIKGKTETCLEEF